MTFTESSSCDDISGMTQRELYKVIGETVNSSVDKKVAAAEERLEKRISDVSTDLKKGQSDMFELMQQMNQKALL